MTSRFIPMILCSTRPAMGMLIGLLTAAAISACSSDGPVTSELPANAVVQVGARTISRTTLEHWIPIEAIISNEAVPQRPVPRGEVPDPPRFVACVAYLRTILPKRSHQTTSQLKDRCQERYNDVRQHILDILITFQWLSAEAEAQHVYVSNRETQLQFAQFKREQFGSDRIFKNYLRYTGETLDDELLVGRMNLLSTKLQQKILVAGGVSAVAKWNHEFPHKWAKRTNCRAGFVIPECMQYKGPLPPEASI